jgi:hypothetical protein
MKSRSRSRSLSPIDAKNRKKNSTSNGNLEAQSSFKPKYEIKLNESQRSDAIGGKSNQS